LPILLPDSNQFVKAVVSSMCSSGRVTKQAAESFRVADHSPATLLGVAEPSGPHLSGEAVKLAGFREPRGRW